jgi:hypothetical protein
MKELENFIKNNKAAFDTLSVPSTSWKKIETHIQDNTRWLAPIRYWQAAAVLFFGLSVYLWTQQPSSIIQRQASKEFADAEAFYTQQISEKVSMINASANGNEIFTRDFQQLEAMHVMLKEELKQRPSDKVRDAIILNLLVQINLLNLQLQQTDEGKKVDKVSTTI